MFGLIPFAPLFFKSLGCSSQWGSVSSKPGERPGSATIYICPQAHTFWSLV